MLALPDRPLSPPSALVDAARERLHDHLDAIADGPATDPTLPSDELVVQSPTYWPGPVRPGAPADTDRYAFGEPFAAGGLGVVRRAEDRRLGRTIAVKELLHHDPAAARRFTLEARITARLQHPGIVPLYDIGWHPGGEPYYCMKLVDGQTLEHKIRDAHDLPTRLALLEHVVAATNAIAYAHRHGVLHRDLKPANILVGELGETVVIDWGLAKDTTGRIADHDPEEHPASGGDGAISTMTAHGSILGTLRYMPPEQARGEVVDARCDVYALGAVLFHLLAGAPPFASVDNRLLAARVADGALEDLRTLAPDAPPELLAIVRRAMAPWRDDRYASAEDLSDDLRRFLTGRLVGAHNYSPGEVLRRWLRRHRAAAAIASISLVVLAAGGAYTVDNIRRERDIAEAARSEAAKRADDALLAHARSILTTDLTGVARSLAQLVGEDPHTWRSADLLASVAAARGLPARTLQAGPAPIVALESLASKILIGLDDGGGVWRWDAGADQGVRVLGLHGEHTALVAAADAPVWAAVEPGRVHVFHGAAATPTTIDTSRIQQPIHYRWHLTTDGRTVAAVAREVIVAGLPTPDSDVAYFWDLQDPSREPQRFGLSLERLAGTAEFSPDLRFIAAVADDGIHLLRRDEGRTEVLPRGELRFVGGVLRDHIVRATAPSDAGVREFEVRDLHTGAARRLASHAMHFLGDDDLLLLDRRNGDPRVSRHILSTGATPWSLLAESVDDIALDPTGTRFAMRKHDDLRAIGELATGVVHHYLHADPRAPMRWLDRDTLAVVAGNTIQVWQPKDAPIEVVSDTRDCAVTPDGKFAATQEEDGSIFRHDLAAGVTQSIECSHPVPIETARPRLLTSIDERGRVLALTDDWSCWTEGDRAVELGPALLGRRPTALPGGGFVVHGGGAVQVWEDPFAPAVEWTIEGPVFELQPNPTGKHLAIRGTGDVTVLHRTSGTREVLPREQTGEELRTSLAWSPHGSTLGVLQPHAGGAELTLWDADAEPMRPSERHPLVDTRAEMSAYLAFTPSGASVVFADRPTSLTILQRADGSTRRMPIPAAILDAHFLAEDRLLAVNREATPMLVDLATAEAFLLQGAAHNGMSSEVQFGQAGPGAPVLMCHALGLGTFVRWTDVVPDAPADMQAWLAGRLPATADLRTPASR